MTKTKMLPVTRRFKFKGRTPNAIPPTILQLGDDLGISISLEFARRIRYISILAIGGDKRRIDEHGNQYPYFYLELHTGDKSEMVRSMMIFSKWKANRLHRSVTRKIAVFIFENQHLNFNPQPMPVRFEE